MYPKLIVIIDTKQVKLLTECVYDERTRKLWSKKQIKERGIESFISEKDMIETLNWNLNGDSTKFKHEYIGADFICAAIYD